MNRWSQIAVVILALAALAVTGLVVSSGMKPVAAALEPGAPMPDFTLKDCDGKEHALAQYKGKIVVIEFCSKECPWSRDVDPDLNALAKQYAEKGVVVLGIDSHHGVTPEQIKAYAAQAKIEHPILKDVGNAYADTVGARSTPEMYVLDKDGKLAYHGAFDDRAGPDSKGQTGYVRDAVDALIAGKPVAVKTMKAWGCSIKRAPK
jgi:peroxiredoxin